ncbi:hypothetical protein [Marivirga harenae]|uniref:hypothetical protein n=1 Tax=Marivirga harenae TaxID=2010992 RepID=UPI0026E0245B|nr:hypothetical protein [Marivirga harenae]WKV12750.1 hypothetical protein Q3Y49_02780 [Marivirga harenae]|tara:strand:- start:7701 stop:8333 length:633 start_codon:yes stop_codon:yes gene_type:complete
MKVFHKYMVIVVALLAYASAVSAQEIGEKHENEEQIKQEEFPKLALELIKPILEKGKRTRFFKEYEKDTYFFEVKTIYKKEKISIKFYKDGNLLDIEILKDFKDLPEEIQTGIKQYFQSNYKNYKFNRIQIQYNREEEYEDGQLEIDDDEEYVEEFLEMDLEDLIIKYEIEAEVVIEKNERGFFEFLFDAEGNIEGIKKIIKRADDNVLY